MTFLVARVIEEPREIAGDAVFPVAVTAYADANFREQAQRLVRKINEINETASAWKAHLFWIPFTGSFDPKTGSPRAVHSNHCPCHE